jgi:hypothetical protein
MCQEPVADVRLPSRMSVVLRCTVTAVAVNVTVHPGSQSCGPCSAARTREGRGQCVRALRLGANLIGQARLHVWNT